MRRLAIVFTEDHRHIAEFQKLPRIRILARRRLHERHRHIRPHDQHLALTADGLDHLALQLREIGAVCIIILKSRRLDDLASVPPHDGNHRTLDAVIIFISSSCTILNRLLHEPYEPSSFFVMVILYHDKEKK